MKVSAVRLSELQGNGLSVALIDGDIWLRPGRLEQAYLGNDEAICGSVCVVLPSGTEARRR